MPWVVNAQYSSTAITLLGVLGVNIYIYARVVFVPAYIAAIPVVFLLLTDMRALGLLIFFFFCRYEKLEQDMEDDNQAFIEDQRRKHQVGITDGLARSLEASFLSCRAGSCSLSLDIIGSVMLCITGDLVLTGARMSWW